MPFDPELDKTLWNDEVRVGKFVLEVKVMKYGEGQTKIQIGRVQKEVPEDEGRFMKLGRLTKEEAEAILPLFQEAVKQMPEEEPSE